MRDLWETVPRLLSDQYYCVLATADEAGSPWATPVFFASRDHSELFWVSAASSRHSRNIAARSEIAATIFDSTVAVGAAEAVYLLAQASVCVDTDAALNALNTRLAPRQQLTSADVLPAGPLTAYRATISRLFVLVRGGNPDFDNVVDARYEVHQPKEQTG